MGYEIMIETIKATLEKNLPQLGQHSRIIKREDFNKTLLS